MTETKNYKLKKPAPEDFYNIDDHNSNMDIIDETLGNKADLDGDGRISENQMPESWNDKQSAITGAAGQYVGFNADGKPIAQDKSTLGFIPDTEKGAANGVASLNSSGQIPTAQIPSLSATYMPKSGGTMTGALVAQSNNNWGTAQVRNIVVSTEDLEDGVSELASGCLWGVYEE